MRVVIVANTNLGDTEGSSLHAGPCRGRRQLYNCPAKRQAKNGASGGKCPGGGSLAAQGVGGDPVAWATQPQGLQGSVQASGSHVVCYWDKSLQVDSGFHSETCGVLKAKGGKADPKG